MNSPHFIRNRKWYHVWLVTWNENFPVKSNFFFLFQIFCVCVPFGWFVASSPSLKLPQTLSITIKQFEITSFSLLFLSLSIKVIAFRTLASTNSESTPNSNWKADKNIHNFLVSTHFDCFGLKMKNEIGQRVSNLPHKIAYGLDRISHTLDASGCCRSESVGKALFFYF